MKLDKVPLFYGLIRGGHIEGLWEARLKSFPNWQPFYLGGCVIRSKEYAEEYACDLCKKAHIEWINHYRSELVFYLSEDIQNPIVVTANREMKTLLKREGYRDHKQQDKSENIKHYWINSSAIPNGEFTLEAIDIGSKEILASTNITLEDQQIIFYIEKEPTTNNIYFKVEKINNMREVKLFYQFTREKQ